MWAGLSPRLTSGSMKKRGNHDPYGRSYDDENTRKSVQDATQGHRGALRGLRRKLAACSHLPDDRVCFASISIWQASAFRKAAFKRRREIETFGALETQEPRLATSTARSLILRRVVPLPLRETAIWRPEFQAFLNHTCAFGTFMGLDAQTKGN